MKKIIYSLVIMIAAGSLFTSCIEPVEPAGIYDLREAKARYYDALSKLRAADALLVEAKADLKKADAEFRRAEVENQNLKNEYQRLLNEAKALDNEKEAAKWAMKLEELQKEHELNMIDYQGKIAQAQEKLRQIMSDIAMAALDLTDAEKTALNKAISGYEKAYADYLDALEAVTAAEATLWNLQYEYDNMYDEEGIYFDYWGEYIRTGEDLVEYYESCVEYYTLYAAYFAAMYEEMAENTDVAEWAEELEELKAELAEREYNRYQVTKDSVEYMQNIFHDGNIEFGLAVAAWMEANPAVAEPKKPTAPKESDYKAADYQVDSIAFDALEYTAPNQAFDKFRSLISSYESVKSLVADTTYNTITVNTTDKKITLIANQQMKDFVLGTETSTKGSQVLKYYDKETKKNVEVKADYGLNGALSVLKRDLVLKGKEGKTPEELAKELKEAKENWENDRDSLLAFYEAVAKVEAAKKGDPYEAYEPIANAKKALKEAKDADGKGQTGMVSASQKLIEVLNGIVSHADLSTPDSTELVKAIVAFATARESYLAYKPYKNSGIDSNKFYYVYSTSPDVLVDSSLNFKDITLDYIRKHPSMKYNWTGGTTYKDMSESGAVKGAAFRTILTQLVGATIADRIKTPATSTEADLNTTAFYDAYKYVAGDPAEIQDLDGNTYVDPAVAKAQTAFDAAVAAFNALFKRYWNIDPAADGNAYTQFKSTGTYKGSVYSPAVYTLATFTEPYNCVAFDEDGETILPTAAIQVILASVDPKADPADFQGTNFNPIKTTSQIFANNETDFYKYMAAAWAADNTDTEEAIKKIEKWIEGVTAAFEKNVTDAEAAAKKAYDKAVSDYDKAKATYDTNKKKYDDYMTALKAFVGVDAKGNPINVAKNSAGAYVPSVTTIAAPVKYQSANVKQTQTGAFTWEGEWKLGGTQKELAEKYMPEFPQKLAAWHSANADNEDKIGHLKAIIDALEKAYMAAIGVVEGMSGAEVEYEWDNVEGYYEDYLDYLQYMVEICLANISWYTDAIAEAEAGYNSLQIAIEIAEHNLAYAQQKLADAEIKLEVAEAYYNKVLAAIEGKN